MSEILEFTKSFLLNNSFETFKFIYRKVYVKNQFLQRNSFGKKRYRRENISSKSVLHIYLHGFNRDQSYCTFFFFKKVGYLFLKNVRRINYTLARKRKMICWCLKKYTDDFLVKIIQNWLKPIIIKNRPKEIKIHLWLE